MAIAHAPKRQPIAAITVLSGAPNRAEIIQIPRGAFEETHLELLISRNEREDHVDVVRRHLVLAMRAMASGHTTAAGTYLVTLGEINEREALRVKSVDVAAAACPDCSSTDCVRLPGHGRAA